MGSGGSCGRRTRQAAALSQATTPFSHISMLKVAFKIKFPYTVYKEIQSGSVQKSYFPIYEEAAFVIYDFATAPFWISFYMRKIWFSFLNLIVQKFGRLQAILLNVERYDKVKRSIKKI
jgi:hypothetical protein